MSRHQVSSPRRSFLILKRALAILMTIAVLYGVLLHQLRWGHHTESRQQVQFSNSERHHRGYIREQGNPSKSRDESSQHKAIKDVQVAVIPLGTHFGNIYYGEVVVGGQAYKLQIDTGSADLWIACSHWRGGGVERPQCANQCPIDVTNILYGSGNVCVQRHEDTVELGGLLRMEQYSFGVAYGANVNSKKENKILLGDCQGILGLAYSGVAVIPQKHHQLVNSLQSFGIYLSGKKHTQSSSLILNGIHHEIIAQDRLQPQRISLLEKKHWTVGISSFQLDDDLSFMPCSNLKEGVCRALLDSGTSFLTMPKAAFSRFVETYIKTSNCELNEHGYYVCQRKNLSLPSISFVLGHLAAEKKKFVLNPSDYTSKFSKDQVIIEIQPSPQGMVGDSWILGDTFMKTYYTTFEVDQSITFYCQDNECSGGTGMTFYETLAELIFDTATILRALIYVHIIILFIVFLLLCLHYSTLHAFFVHHFKLVGCPDETSTSDPFPQPSINTIHRSSIS